MQRILIRKSTFYTFRLPQFVTGIFPLLSLILFLMPGSVTAPGQSVSFQLQLGEQQADSVDSLAFSPDGKLFAIGGGAPGHIAVYDLATGSRLKSFCLSSSDVGALAFSADGKILAAGSWDIKAWDVNSGKLVESLDSYPAITNGIRLPITALQFGPQGSILACGTQSTNIVLLSFDHGLRSRSLPKFDGGVTALQFSKDGSRLLCSGKSTTEVWDMAGLKVMASYSITQPTAFTADCRSCCGIGSFGSNIEVKDPETGEDLCEIDPHAVLSKVALSPDGNIVAAADAMSGRINLWRVGTGERVATLPTCLDSVGALAFHPNNRILANAANAVSATISPTAPPGMVNLWDIATGQELCSIFSFGTDDWLVVAPDGKYDGSTNAIRDLRLVTTNGLHALPQNLADLSTQGLLGQLFHGQPTAVADTGTQFQDSARPAPRISIISPESCMVSTNGESVIQLKAADSGGGISGVELYQNNELIDSRSVSELQKSSAGKYAAAFTVKLVPGLNSFDAIARRDQTHQEKEFAEMSQNPGWLSSPPTVPDSPIESRPAHLDLTLKDNRENRMPVIVAQTGHSDSLNAIAFSNDGRILASASQDKTIKLWDLTAEKQFQTLEANSAVKTVAFNKNQLLASAEDDRTVKLWDIKTGQVLYNFYFPENDANVKQVRFTRDGTRLFCSSDDKIVIWDVRSRRQVCCLNDSDGITQFDLDANGNWVITGDNHGSAKLWNLSSGSIASKFVGHSNAVDAVAFSPDEKHIATGGRDHSIKIWNADPAELLETINASNSVTCLAFTRDGNYLVSGESGSFMKIWSVSDKKADRVLSLKPLNDDGEWVEQGNEKSLVLSPDGNMLAVIGSTYNDIRLWDTYNWQMFSSLKPRVASVNFVAFLADTNVLLSGGSTIAKSWNTADGRLISSISAQLNNPFDPTVFTPDMKTRAWMSDGNGTITVQDFFSGTTLQTIPGNQSDLPLFFQHYILLSPDGAFVGRTTKDGTVKIWNTKSGSPAGAKTLKTVLGSGDLFSENQVPVTIGPGGKTFVFSSGYFNGTPKKCVFWDVPAQKEMFELPIDLAFNDLGAFDMTGRFFAGATRDGIELWDINIRKKLFVLRGHTDDVLSLAFRDGQRLASGGADGTTRIWDLKTGDELVSLIAIDKDDFITATPEGYYSSSLGAFNGVAFRVGDRAYPFEQFDLKYNRPDKVLEALSTSDTRLIEAYHRAYEKRLGQMGFTEKMLDGNADLPEAAITTANIPASTQNKSITFHIKASDPGSNLLDRINVYVNDVPIYGVAGINLRNKQVTRYDQDITLELSAGKNIIQVSVINQKGLESLKQTVDVNCECPATKPDLYLVAIGVSKYANTNFDLTCADKDADDLATFFESHKDEFGQVHIVRILNEQATNEQILAMKKFFAQSHVDDHVILFLAGHGLLDEKLDYYFATHDVDFAHPANRGLPYEAIESLLDGIPARQKLLLMDTCHAGEVDKSDMELAAADPSAGRLPPGVHGRGFQMVKMAGGIGLQNSFQLSQELFDNLQRGSGAAIISAAGGEEFAYENNGNGVFTFSVLEGLQSGKRKVSELRDYVRDRVQQLTGGRQTPTSRRENLENDFNVF